MSRYTLVFAAAASPTAGAPSTSSGTLLSLHLPRWRVYDETGGAL